MYIERFLLTSFCWAAFMPSASAAPADLNQNGIPDLAELYIPAVAQFPPATDSDSDGRSNLEEIQAGTDPFDESSVFRQSNLGYLNEASDDLEFTFSSVEGVRYQIQSTETLTGTWNDLLQVVASGPLTTVAIPPASVSHDPDKCFFRAGVVPSSDTDSDGLEDSLELYLGFDPASSSSVRSASEGGDYAQFLSLMTGANSNGGLFHSSTAGIPSEEQASRFFAQAAFGANEEMISQLRALGANAYEQWIDHQLALPATTFQPYTAYLDTRLLADSIYPESNFNNPSLPHYVTKNGDLYIQNVRTAWLRHALFAPDRLRQRAAWALSQILVLGTPNGRYGKTNANFYDLLLDGAFESYADLIYEVSINPGMGRYLSSVGNRKADPSISQMPDENYAREIMQLFTIGLWELHSDGTRRLDVQNNPIPTYTNDDIIQVARVFTGLEYDNPGGSFSQRLANHPMKVVESRHDDGDATMASVYGTAAKTFLQGAFYSPTPLPPGRTTLQDVRDTCDILVDHPSCPPFISKNLIQHLVTSNPSPAYVGRVSAVFIDDGNGNRGNIGAVIKAILLDDEARAFSPMMGDSSGRLKGPMLRLVTLARAFDSGSATPALHDDTGIQFWGPSAGEVYNDFAEFPFAYPSVFNFYEPGYARQGEILDSGLVSPEFQILNSQTSVGMPNRFWEFIEDGFHTDSDGPPPTFELILDDWTPLVNNTDELIDQLNILFCHGTLGAASREVVIDSLDAQTSLSPTERMQLAIYLVMTSPEAAVLR